MNDLTRREFGKLSLGTFLLGAAANWSGLSLAANPTGEKLHGLSAFGELKYGPDVTRFDYVNADAPKGGVFNFSVPNWAYNQNPQTFDTLNTFTLRNNAPPRVELTYDALMARALDEPTTIYGRLAESVEISDDRNAYTFVLREGPRFHDGSPVTAADVAFSYDIFKEKGHPQLQVELTHLEAAEMVDERTVTLRFNGNQSARTILTVALMPVISKAFFEANDFEDTGLDPVLGSGPYKVGRLSQGVFIEYNRV
ncbi:MAG: ABC transporter substrate-binding protein, partial [Pseudomonadota bacterium]